MRPTFSESDFDPAIYEDVEEVDEAGIEQSELWTITSGSTTELRKASRSKSISRAKSVSTSMTKTFSKSMTKSFSKFSKTQMKSASRFSRIMKSTLESSIGEPATTLDDLEVHVSAEQMK